jgi:uncharacterized protein YlzI (FlbEa/FlbD family)
MADALAVVQMLFYVTAGTVIVLTYLNARKSLLNPVHTEYQKHVISRLKELSEELDSEFDANSPNYWMSEGLVKEAVDEINETFREHRKDILVSGEWEGGGLSMSEGLLRIQRLARSVKSDPFIPPNIRQIIVDYCAARAAARHSAEQHALSYYRRQLAQGRNLETLDENWNWVHNLANHELHQHGFGIVQVEEKVEDIRSEIQRYLESFNPTS